MNIIEKIKTFLNRRKQKAFPTLTQDRAIHSVNKKDRSWILNYGQKTQPTKLDVEIDRFLHSFSNNIKKYNIRSNDDLNRIAYTSLTRMNGKSITEKEYRKNYYNEQALLNEIYYNRQYTIQTQGTQENTHFYHIKAYGYQLPEDKDLVRVYINCNNGNIAELSQLLLNCNNNPNFYMKFTSNISNSRSPRGEKIVIYCRKDELNYTAQLINYTKSISPHLYKESENVLPFLQSINNTFSVSSQPVTDQFMCLDGRTRTIAKSKNSFLANILSDSYIGVAKEIARSDANLSFLLHEQNINNEALYVSNYDYINYFYHDYLLNSMKAKMAYLCAQNNQYIEGLHQETLQNNARNIEQYYERGAGK